MTFAALTPAKSEPPRDQYDRYLLPVMQPDGTVKERVAHTRVTTIAKAIADTYNLEQWQLRMVAKGIGLRQDLYALAAATPVDDRKTLNNIARQAKDAAASSKGANTGTALHSFTEADDRGEHVNVPAPWDLDVAAYRAMKQRHGIQLHEWWIERVLYLPGVYAGTCDRLCWLPGEELGRIGDLKTGGFLSYDEIALQLAMYANATHWYDPATDQWGLVPPINREWALVFHLPAGTADCQAHEVNVVAGWEAVHHALWVREWRKRKDIARPLPVPGVAA